MMSRVLQDNHYYRSSSIYLRKNRILHSNHERWIVTRIVTFGLGSVPRSILACYRWLHSSQSNRIKKNRIEVLCYCCFVHFRSDLPHTATPSMCRTSRRRRRKTTQESHHEAQNTSNNKSKFGKMGSTNKARTIRRTIVAAANNTLSKARINDR